jgi:hypothetical protein
MEWINEHPTPSWDALPLTHITRGVVAEDIIRDGRVEPSQCKVFGEPLAYFFYGRPAYRIGAEATIKAEALCPYCFVFRPELIDRAKCIHAFDTGAFNARLYSNVIANEMDENDFQLQDESTPNRLISLVFRSQLAYFLGDTRAISSQPPAVHAHQFHARAYLDLILSPGRNEPDDRVFTIEVVFGDPVPLSGSLMAVVLPHTLWSGDVKAPWLEALSRTGVNMIPYEFIPGRPPEHYHTLLELTVRRFYEKRGYLQCDPC